MSSLFAIGSRSQTFFGFPVFATSADGIDWVLDYRDDLKFKSPLSVEYGNNYITIGFSNFLLYRDITSSSDYQRVQLPSEFSLSDISYTDDVFLICGIANYTVSYGPYSEMTEVAQIYRLDPVTGVLSMVWTHNEVNSVFYKIRKLDNIVMVCGAVNGAGDAWYSQDSGNTWNQVAIPPTAQIFTVNRVEFNGNWFFYWGSQGILYRSTSLTDNNWLSISTGSNNSVVDIVTNGEILVALGQTSVYYTLDGVNLNEWKSKGYFYDSAIFFSDRLIVYARSNLTQYTQWYTDDFEKWIESDSGVFFNKSVILP
jgi:hypothetical protein